jgi:eukaryotic-like serine/threonine-protein kinase
MASKAPQFPAGTLLGGKYRVDGLLGEGGMGAVFLATNTAIGRKVAIKVLVTEVAERADIQRRFELEAQAAAVIDHPGIVDVLDMGSTDEGQPFIVMEYLEGATLRSLFKAQGAFTPAQAVAVMAPVLDALAAAHRAHVIHRDVKPANIFVCVRPREAVKLLDFGVSRFGGGAGLTLTGSAVGTPKYMSPEQVLGEKEVGPQADLYSVGAVLYHLLSGRPPHEANSDIAALALALTTDHRPLLEARPGLPAGLGALVDELLRKEPRERPADAAAVRGRLLALVPRLDSASLFEAAARSARVSALPPTPASARLKSKGSAPARRGAPAPTSRATLLAAGAGLVLAGGVAAAVLLARAPGAPPPDARLVRVEAEAPRTSQLVVSLEPSGSTLTVDGQATPCPSPCTLERPRGASVRLAAAAAGYEPRSLDLVLTDPRQTVALALAPLPLPPPVVAVDAGRPAKRKRPTGLDVEERNPYR